MLNQTINQISSNLDFAAFLNNNFMKEISYQNFPENYKLRRLPQDEAQSWTDQSEVKSIRERELIRDNIYLKYKFDIFENPFIVFYEDNKSMRLKPFKKQIDAHNFSNSILNQGIYSMLISIMNKEIECQIYKS